MKWPKKKQLQHGDQRRVNRFAYYPTLVDQGRWWVWLERYVELQEYYNRGDDRWWWTVAKVSYGA